LFLLFIKPIAESLRLISGSVSTEHSFAAQLEAIYKYGIQHTGNTVFMSAFLVCGGDL